MRRPSSLRITALRGAHGSITARMPYRIDVDNAPAGAIDRLIELGALDVDAPTGRVAAIMPDAVVPERVARELGGGIRVTAARGRGDGSVWVIQPRTVQVGRFQIMPAERPPQPGAVRIIDAEAFGTGLHATTTLCLAAL